ncbi:SDR family oxidoreductase [Sphingomonas sp. 28-63-12]|uniref:SDR family oxidoreductase n=1 Tax=Sphingomonas sp. 28-63-12 TaxID=1970434 RepID=UPI0035A84A95
MRRPCRCQPGDIAGLTKSAAIEYARAGRRVNVICPGLVETAMTAAWFEDEGFIDGFFAASPIGRAAQPEEIAGTVLLSARPRRASPMAASLSSTVARPPFEGAPHETPDRRRRADARPATRGGRDGQAVTCRKGPLHQCRLTRRHYVDDWNAAAAQSKTSAELRALIVKLDPQAVDVRGDFLLGSSFKVTMGEEPRWTE